MYNIFTGSFFKTNTNSFVPFSMLHCCCLHYLYSLDDVLGMKNVSSTNLLLKDKYFATDLEIGVTRDFLTIIKSTYVEKHPSGGTQICI